MSHVSQLQFVSGQPEAVARLRERPEDFQVSEQLSFGCEGRGQHVFLHIEKRGLNTEQLARSLARFAGVRPLAVGYAGLKDRHAVARQWLSVDLAGKPEPVWEEFNSRDIRVLSSSRHSRKLRRGAVRSNQFQICLRGYSGQADELQRRLEAIRQHGVPNYFGEQRFGNDESNLAQFEKLVQGELTKVKPHLRGLYLSAGRSFLFNQVLSRRVADKTWNQALPGDVMMLDGSHSIFHAPGIDEVIQQRVAAFDIHPTAPLWGSGELMSTEAVHALEQQCLLPHHAWCQYLEQAGLKQERRATRVRVDAIECQWQQPDVVLTFKLPAGSYATVVLRELVRWG